MKILAGTAIAVVFSMTVAPAVMAESMMEQSMMNQSMPEMTSSNLRPDLEIQSIEDGQLTVKMMDSGMMQTFMIMPETVEELSLSPGSLIELNYDNLMIGTVASATQTNIDVDFETQERTTYAIPESGNDYDLSDKVAVTPDRILGKVSEWQLSAADITVLNPDLSSSTAMTVEPVADSTPDIMADEDVEPEVEVETEVVPGLW